MDPKKKYPFPSNHRSDWLKAARKELGDKDPISELSKTAQGLRIRPYYDSEDLTFAVSEPLPAATDGFAGARAWVNAPLVVVQDEITANKLALAHLNTGADGILFKVAAEVDLSKLLKHIQLTSCSIFFNNSKANFQATLAKWLKADKVDQTGLKGAIFAEKFTPPESVSFYTGTPGFFAAGIKISKASPEDELYGAISAVIQHLLPVADVRMAEGFFNKMAFQFSIGTDFFIEIAKLKGFRVLWKHLMAAYGMDESIRPYIHAVSEPWTNEKFEPNANMLKGTTASMAAVLGGADALTSIEDADHPFKSRIARNVSSVLREESRLGLVSDPTAGAFFLESVIHQLSETVWGRLVKDFTS